ncbi:MAG: phosphate/phosphite/phosphonate ABC transporter substrate-binding protein [Magnetococcales bacterium]|nr:phosphate/phosphite/phosphonate ABC transporter substrate-binding protein [Magnetococcales bacterium]
MISLVTRALLLGCLLFGGMWVSAAPATANTLTMGSIGNQPMEEIQLFSPVVHYLATQLAPQGITKGRVVVAASIQEMADLMQSGRVDLYLDSPLPALLVDHLSGGNMVLRRWKQGQAEYHSTIFVKQDGPIHTLAQLAGQLVGFKDPFSSSSYLLPRIAMEQAGLQLADMTNRQGKVPADKIGFVFTNDRETNLFWVVTGKTVAGAMSPEELAKQAKGDRNTLRIIHETVTIPRHVVNLRGDLPEPLAKALIEALLAMEHSTTGKPILDNFEQTTRFDPIPPATRSRLQEMTPAVLAILGGHP